MTTKNPLLFSWHLFIYEFNSSCTFKTIYSQVIQIIRASSSVDLYGVNLSDEAKIENFISLAKHVHLKFQLDRMQIERGIKFLKGNKHV